MRPELVEEKWEQGRMLLKRSAEACSGCLGLSGGKERASVLCGTPHGRCSHALLGTALKLPTKAEGSSISVILSVASPLGQREEVCGPGVEEVAVRLF